MLKSAFLEVGGSLKILCIAEASVDLESVLATSSKVDSNIEKLDLSWCDGLDEKLASALVQRSPSLRSFVARKLDMKSATGLVTNLALHCDCLEKLSLARCSCVIDADLIELSKSTLSNSLRLFDVSWNEGITVVGINSLVSSC